VWTPFYFLAPRHLAWFVPKFWSRSSVWLMEAIAGTKMEISGTENLPRGSYILAPKHQSLLDTIAFLPYIPDALYILKRELRWIPFFGWYIIKMRMVPVDRGRRAKALGARRARSPITNGGSPNSTASSASPSCRWRTRRVCSGRGASSCAIRAG
jgi:1-acyl-sn-glycerol-3-phosphate acyltransferase